MCCEKSCLSIATKIYTGSANLGRKQGIKNSTHRDEPNTPSDGFRETARSADMTGHDALVESEDHVHNAWVRSNLALLDKTIIA